MSDLENHVGLAAESKREGRSSTAAHTSGPWSIHVGPFDKEIIIQEPGVTVDYDDVDHAEALANASLIAAAPDMLVALKLALHDYTLNDSVARVVEAAIAKATGAAC